VIRRHGFAALSTVLAIAAVVLLAADEAHAAVYLTLAAMVLAFAGAAVTAAHHRGS